MIALQDDNQVTLHLKFLVCWWC